MTMIREGAYSVVVLGIAVALFWLCGCDHTHMSPHFGEANRAAYHAQVIDPNAGSGVRPDQPLDPEESAIVAATYFRSMRPADERDQEAPKSTVLVVPPAQAGALQPPPQGPQP
jgi:hypothetical protein